MQMPARGFAAFGVAIRIDSLLLSAVAQPLAALLPYGCGSADLVEVQPNFRLLWICTILLLPAKAALLRSPRLGGAFLAGIGFFFVGQADEIVDACMVESGELPGVFQRKRSLAALVFGIERLVAHQKFCDLLLREVFILPQITNP
jgi:hypothetical protein